MWLAFAIIVRYVMFVKYALIFWYRNARFKLLFEHILACQVHSLQFVVEGGSARNLLKLLFRI